MLDLNHLATLFGLGVSLLILKLIIDKAILTRRRSTLKSQWQTAPIPSLPTRNLGIDNMRAFIAALQKFTLPQYLVARQKSMIAVTGNSEIKTFTNRIGLKMQIVTSCPKNIQGLLAKKFADFGVGEVRRRTLSPFMGNAIFSSEGEEWSHFRGTLRPQFTRNQVADLGLEERHIQIAMRALQPNTESGWTDIVCLQDIFFRFTMDTATEFLFGQSCNSQLAAMGAQSDFDDELGELAAKFAISFDVLQDYISRLGKMDAIRWLIPKSKEVDEHAKVVHGFVDHFIHLRRAANPDGFSEKKDEKHEGEKYVFLDAIAPDTPNDHELRSQLLQIIFAGRDTTASLLSWLFRCMIEQPEIFTKLRRTILNEFGPYSSDTSSISFTSLKNCRYLQYCINETLRLHPVVPLARRTAIRDTCLPTGGGPDGTQPIFVAKGQPVEYSIYVMHRDPSIWGPDADSFRPERWDESGISGGAKRAWDFLPFSGGPRICIGQQFALTEAGYVIVRMLQRFEAVEGVREMPGGEVLEGKRALDPEGIVRYNSLLTTAPADQVTVRLKEAVMV